MHGRNVLPGAAVRCAVAVSAAFPGGRCAAVRCAHMTVSVVVKENLTCEKMALLMSTMPTADAKLNARYDACVVVVVIVEGGSDRCAVRRGNVPYEGGGTM
eukprot:5264617-Prymnesium_polylepis.1